MNDFYNPTLGSKIWIFLIHIQQLCSEVIKDDQLILNNIFKKQNIIAIIPPLLFKSCDWAIIKLSEVGHVRALEIGQGCGCADTPPTPTPDSSRGWHRDHSSSILLSSSSSFLLYLPFFFIFPASIQTIWAGSPVTASCGHDSSVRSADCYMSNCWKCDTGLIWNKPIVAETMGEIVTVGSLPVTYWRFKGWSEGRSPEWSLSRHITGMSRAAAPTINSAHTRTSYFSTLEP